jgi:hypothetical protein
MDQNLKPPRSRGLMWWLIVDTVLSVLAVVATASPMASELVRPGLSMPNRATRPVDPVVLAVAKLEVRLRLARPMQLGPDAGVVGRQRAVGQAGPEAPDVALELRRLGRIDRIVLGLDIDEVRPEHGLTAQILAVVGAQRAGDRRRIDEPFERRLAGQAEIDALAEMAGGDAVGGIALDGRPHPGRRGPAR